MAKTWFVVVVFIFATPVAGSAQEDPSNFGNGLTLSGRVGLFSLYRGGETYMVSALWTRPRGVGIEVAYEFTPAPAADENATLYWVGLQLPRQGRGNGLYYGGRIGALRGPFENGVLFDVHAGLQIDWDDVGLRVEPAFLAGGDSSFGLGGRLTVGLAWTFR